MLVYFKTDIGNIARKILDERIQGESSINLSDT